MVSVVSSTERPVGRAVGVVGTAYDTLISIAVETVFVIWDVTNSIGWRAVGIETVTAIVDRDAPATVITHVAVRAVAVLDTLGRALVSQAELPGQAGAGSRVVCAFAVIVNWPDTRGTLREEMKLVVEGERPLQSAHRLVVAL